MTTTYRNLIDSKLTGRVPKARDLKTEEGSRTHINGQQGVNAVQDSNGLFICQYCQRGFPKLVGLSVHITRWCKLNPSGAGGSVPPQAAHGLAEESAQNHNSVSWGYARIHVDSKRPSDVLNSVKMRPRLRLPNSNNNKKWRELDKVIEAAIVMSMSAAEFRHERIDDVMRRFTNVVYETAAKICGTAEGPRKVKTGPDTKQRQPAMLHKLRMLKRDARREMRRTRSQGGDVSVAHREFMRAVRAHHDYLHLVQDNKQLRCETAERKRFLQDPHAYAKRLLNPPVTGKPNFSKDVADSYFKDTYHDSNRSFEYKPPMDVPRPNLPAHAFEEEFASFEEFSEICKSRSNGSAPGFNGIPYLLYKRCPEVRRWLWTILQRVWKDRSIPTAFQVGRIRLLPKSDDTSHPKLMRPISILNVEGRLFWTVFQKRLSKFMLTNGYIDSRVQKGFLEGVAGCIEHTSMQWEMLKHAKDNQRGIVMAWLDLENAYGSVRHMLVQFALKWYHVPPKISELVFRYYDSIFLKVATDDWMSDFFHLGIGVPQGCTASTVVFDVGFQLILDQWKWLTRKLHPGYSFGDGRLSVACPTYADDIELVATIPKDCQQSIDAIQTALEWTKTLKAKPVKCRSLAFRQFRHGEKAQWKKVMSTQYSSFDPLLKINNVAIKFVGDDDPPFFKHLGRFIQHNLQDDLIKKQVEEKLLRWLQIVEESPLEGRMKAWIVNFHVCAKLAWLLMVQDFPVTDVRKWQAHIHRKFRHWIGLAQSSESSILYRSNEHFGLNFKNLIQMEKQLRVVKWHILKYSKDVQARQLYQYRLALDRKGHIGRGNRTSPCLTLENLERACALDRVASGHFGRRGLGYRCTYRKVDSRAEIIQRMKSDAEEKRMIVLHQYEMQTSWLSWGLDEMIRKDLNWNSLLHDYSNRLLKFMVNVQTNTLPTPDNLRRWTLKRNVVCGLCGQNEVTLSHILAGCPWIRATENNLDREDRYTWRHNNVLALIAAEIKEHINRIRKLPEKKSNGPLIRFVRAGQPGARSSAPRPQGLLSQATDWIVNFDLPEFRLPFSKYQFPCEVCATPLKMDGYILSRTARLCVGVELTVPMEHNIATWHTTKLRKYENEIRLEAARNRWRFESIILEVGARGWIPSSVPSLLSSLGLPAVNNLCKRLSIVAIRSSYMIWLNRFNRDFFPWRLRDNVSNSALAGGKDWTLLRGGERRVLGSGKSLGEIKALEQKTTSFSAAVSATERTKVSKQREVSATVERKVLVDGKMLRDGKRSDAEPAPARVEGPGDQISTAIATSIQEIQNLLSSTPPSSSSAPSPVSSCPSSSAEENLLNAYDDLVRHLETNGSDRE